MYIVGVLLLLAVLGSYADGNTDDNYLHFAVEKPQNIIMGDSRGSQAVVSSVLQKKLSSKFDNFSLNITQSPYGEYYFKALKRKINPDTKHGVFILTVDPFNLSLPKHIKLKSEFSEEVSPFKDMYFYNLSPNYEYLIRYYKRSWFKIYSERAENGHSNTFLHNDGWLEVNVDMNKDSVKLREESKVKFYHQFAQNLKLSDERLKSFNDIIDFLKEKGTVYIVRIPASKQIMNIENENFPQFNEIMQNIADKNNLKYFDFSSQYPKFDYTDGNHMYKESGKIFTSQIADSIIVYQKSLK